MFGEKRTLDDEDDDKKEGEGKDKAFITLGRLTSRCACRGICH